MSMFTSRLSVLSAAALVQMSCGVADLNVSSDAASASDTALADREREENLQLKGTGLLAQSLFNTLGPGKDLTDEEGPTGEPVSLFDTYGANFGLTAGLRFGEVYADSPSTAYLLALSILADNAARRCQEEILLGNQSLCHCDTPTEAQHLLQRAYPYIDFASGTHDGLVDAFHQQCLDDYPRAISAVIAALAFAIKG